MDIFCRGCAAAARPGSHHAGGRGWSPPRTWSTACASTPDSTAIPSRTPPVEPGRLTISVVPAKPARPRESTAAGTPAAAPAARMASAMPGTSRSMTMLVISGVTSPRVRPVPPVVTTTSYPAATPSRSACSTTLPSGITTGPSTSQSASRSRPASTGPDLSGYVPAAARLEIVMASARIMPVSSCPSPHAASSWPPPGARLAAGLLLDPDVRDHCGRIDRLDHVDHGQCPDRDCRQGFHLDPGPVRGACRGCDQHAVVFHLEIDGDRVQPD